MALTNNWFDLHFGWNDKGDMPIIPPRKRADGLPTLTPADTTSVTKLNSTPVTQGTVDNCLSDVCNYIGDSYSEYVTGAAVETLVDMFGVLPYKSKGGCELTLVSSSPCSLIAMLIFQTGRNVIKLLARPLILVVCVPAMVNQSCCRTLHVLDLLGTCLCHITVMGVLRVSTEEGI